MGNTVWKEIATIDSEQTFTNKTYDANGTGNVLSNVDIGNMTAACIVTSSETVASAADDDLTLPTTKAIKAYVDAQSHTDTIDSLTDTTIADVATGELLQYTGSAWENKTKAEAAVANSGANSDITSMTGVSSVEPADASGNNTTGTNFTIQGGAGTGDALGGQLLLKVCPAGDSGVGVNTAETAITIDSDKTVTVAGDLVVSGTTTTINTATLDVEDANIKLANVRDTASPSVSTGNGAGITVKTADDDDATYFADLTWKMAQGGGNTDGTEEYVGLTGWRVKNSRTSNTETNHALAIMDFDTNTGAPANTITSAGIGSFIFNTVDDKLYVRVSDA